MNIMLLGHYDIASLYAMDRVIGLLPEHEFTVFLSGELQSAAASEAPLAKLAAFDAQVCETFLAEGGVATQLTSQPAALGAPNSAEGVATLAKQQPDLIISIRYRHILRDAAIAIPRIGVLNLHSGILPDYRGVMATFWAMLDGVNEIGSTLHWIVDSGIDTGPILEIRKRPVPSNNSYLANVLGLYADGCDSIATAVHSIAAGNTLPQQMQTYGGQYFSVPKAADIHRFESKGMVLFDGKESDHL